MRHRGPVLVDTNAIVEAHRVHAWNALARGYAVNTVEDYVTETQTGFQRRAQERRVEAQTCAGHLRPFAPSRTGDVWS